MKISKGKISNVSKKIFAVGLTFVFLPTVFAGCMNHTNFVYERNEKGEYVCVENVEHNYLENCKVVVFELDGELSFYIAKVINYGTGASAHPCYYNVFGEQLIYDASAGNTSSIKIISEENLTAYLVAYDMVQHEYTEEDLYEVLERVKSDYESKNNKVLVKE